MDIVQILISFSLPPSLPFIHFQYCSIGMLFLAVFMLGELWLGYKLVASAGSTLVHWSSSLVRAASEAPSGPAPDGTINTKLAPTTPIGEFICPVYKPEVTCPVYEGQQDGESCYKSICPIYKGQQDEGEHRVGGESVGPPPRIVLYWVSTYFDLEEARRHGRSSVAYYSDPNSWTSRFSKWLFYFASELMRFYRWYCDGLDCVLLGLPLAWLFGSVPSFVKFARGIYWGLELVFGHVERDLSTGKKDAKKDNNDFSRHSIARTVVGSIYFLWTAMRILDSAGVPARAPVPNLYPIALLLYSSLAVVFGADFLDFRWVARWAQNTVLIGFIISINAAMILLHVGLSAVCLQYNALLALRESFYISIAMTRLAFAVIRLAFVLIRYVFICWINQDRAVPVSADDLASS